MVAEPTRLNSLRIIVAVVATAFINLVACLDATPPDDRLDVVRAADTGSGGDPPVSDVTITIILPPDVDPNAPVVPVDELVLFLAMTTGGAGDINYEWDFGDGTIVANGSLIDHTYSLAGLYVVTVSVLDLHPETGEIVGAAAESVTLVVEGGTNTPPSIEPPPDVVLGTNAGTCAAAGVALGTPEVTDDADGIVVDAVRIDGEPLAAPYPAGVTAVTWTATDVGGLTASAIQLVTVYDTEPPVIAAPADLSVSNDPGLGTVLVDVGSATATDNCETAAVGGERGDGEALQNPYPVGATVIVWTATDAAGNQAAAEQTITVNDAEAPSLALPAGFSLAATSPEGATVVYEVTASDNLPGAVVYCAPDSRSTFPIGTTAVSCTAIDAAGNTTHGTFTVTVLGAAEQIASLIESINDAPLPSELRRPLVRFLENALNVPARGMAACRMLDVFVAVVRVKTGRQIPVDDADRLIADASRIQNVLGCP